MQVQYTILRIDFRPQIVPYIYFYIHIYFILVFLSVVVSYFLVIFNQELIVYPLLNFLYLLIFPYKSCLQTALCKLLQIQFLWWSHPSVLLFWGIFVYVYVVYFLPQSKKTSIKVKLETVNLLQGVRVNGVRPTMYWRPDHWV